MISLPLIKFSRPLFFLALLLPLAYLAFIVRRTSGGLNRRRLLRLAALVVLVLALATPRIGSEVEDRSSYILVDLSDSVTRSVDLDSVEKKVEQIMKANDESRFGVISFARKALMEKTVPDPDGESYSVGRIGLSAERLSGDGTDLKAGVDLALANLGSKKGIEIFVLSDGRIHQGYEEALGQAKAGGHSLFTVPIGSRLNEDLALDSLNVPSRVQSGRPFRIEWVVRSPVKSKGTLALYRDGRLRMGKEVQLNPGLNGFSLKDSFAESGPHSYRVTVKGQEDPIPENDSLSSSVLVSGEADLLVLGKGEFEGPLRQALDSIGRQFRFSNSLPPLEELAHYRAILVTDLPFGELTVPEIERMRRFVSQLGGGLLLTGGREELSGWEGGRLEEILPLSYKLPQKTREPGLAVIYVLDSSSSMQAQVQGGTKEEMLKEATAASVDLLDTEDLIGVISFDREFSWLVPISQLKEGGQVYQGLRQLKAGGGTDLFYPLESALEELKEVEGRVKHILLVSDGKTVTEDRDFPGLIARLKNEEDITLSAIATGPSPNLDMLRELVEAGEGRLYRAADFQSLPRVSMKLTQRLNRKRFITGNLQVDGPLVQGKFPDLPPLKGYVLTYPKPSAQKLLTVKGDPVLARWRLGLGRVGVLNADLRGGWSREWLAWGKGGSLVEELLSSIEGDEVKSQGLRLNWELTRDRLLARVEAREEDGSFANSLQLSIDLLPTGEEKEGVQVAPGAYEVALARPPAGSYLLQVSDHTRNREERMSVSLPYQREYEGTGVDRETLRNMAEETGGRFLEDELLGAVEGSGGRTFRFRSIDGYFLLLALALILTELILRKKGALKEKLFSVWR